MAKLRINWNLTIVLALAVIAVAITGVSLRKYHRQQRAEVGLTEGLEAYEAGQWSEAAAGLGRYLALRPNDIEVLIKYARSQLRIQPFKRKYLEQAINAYRAVLRLEDHEEAAEEIVQLYLRFGMPAEAELIARRFVEKSDKILFHQALAGALMAQRKYEAALTVLIDLVRQDPGQIAAYRMLGEIAEKRPDLIGTDARDWFDRAVAENPESAQAYILRSTYLAKNNEIEAAVADLEKAEQCDLSETNIRLSLASAWMQRRDYDRARSHLDVLKAQHPASEELWYLWAQLASEMGDAEQMVQIAEEGLENLGQTNYTFLPLATELLIQAHRLDRARDYIAILNEAEAERGMMLYLEGLLARASMDWSEAIRKWQQAIQLGFSSEMIYLNLAETLDQLNNRPMAIQILRRYVSRSEGTFKGHLHLARLLAKDHYWQQALEQATASVQLDPTSPEAQTLYLRCQIELADMHQEVEVTLLRDAIGRLIDTRDTLAGRLLMFHLAVCADDLPWAETIIRDAERQYGPEIPVVLANARLLMAQEKVDECIRFLEPYADRYPDSNELIKLLAWGYSRDGQFEKCRTLLTTAAANARDLFNQRSYRLWQAESLLLEDRRDDAVEMYRRMAAENDSDIYVRRQLLSLQQDLADSEQLQEWVNEIKAAEGEGGWQWKYEQARLWFNQDEEFERRYEQIVRLLNENLSLNPDDQASRVLLASTHERAGNIQLSLSLYQDAITKQVKDLELIVAAVGTMYRAEEYRQAQEFLNRVAEKGVWDPRLAQYEIQNNLRIGQEENAITVLEKIVNRSPDDVDAKLSLALLQMRRQDFDKAEQNVLEVIAARPDSAAAAAARADLYLEQGKPQEALRVCDDFLTEHDTLPAHAMRCQVLLNTGDEAGVIEGIQRIQEKFDDDKDALLVVSRLYESIGRAEASIAILDRLLVTYADDFAVQKQAALLFAGQQDTARRNKGKALLERALQENPQDVALRLKKAALLVQENNTIAFEEASLILNHLVREFPRLEEAWHALGQLSLIERKPAQAMDYALRGLYYLPDSKPLLLLKAQAESARSPISAVSTLSLLLREDPENQTVILMLSQNYRKAGKYQDALQLLQKNLGRENLKGSLDLKRELMTVFYELGDEEDAESLYEELIHQTGDGRILLSWLEMLSREKSPADIRRAYQAWAEIHPEAVEDVIGSVVGILAGMEQPERCEVAETIVNSILEKNPHSAEACYAMAMLYHLTEQKQKAIPWYEKTIQLNPQHVIAMNNLAWILCTEKSDYRKALTIAEKGLLLRSSYADLIDTRGVIYMHLGDYEKAVEDFKHCERLYFDVNPSKTSAVFRLGKCLMLLGKEQQSLVELFKAKDMNAANGGLSSEELAELEEMIQAISQNTAFLDKK